MSTHMALLSISLDNVSKDVIYSVSLIHRAAAGFSQERNCIYIRSISKCVR